MRPQPANDESDDRLRVLVVEDDLDCRLVAAQTLVARGHSVEMAADAEVAIALLERGGIDVVVTDLRLPGVQGENFALAIQHGWPDVGVVALTGYDTPSTRARCEYAHVDVFMRKPVVHGRSLDQAVRRAAERRRPRRQTA